MPTAFTRGNMITKKLMKQYLGKSYIDINSKNKRISGKQLIKAINLFINKYKDVGVFYDYKTMSGDLCSYASKTGCRILNTSYISNRLSYSVYNRVSGAWLRGVFVSELDGVRKMILLWSNDEFTELNEEQIYSRDILKLYKTFVYDIIDLKYHMRIIKESINFINNLKNKYLVRYRTNTVLFKKINSIDFDRDNLRFRIEYMTNRVNIDTQNRNLSDDATYLYDFQDLMKFINRINETYETLDIDENISSKMEDKVVEAMTKRIKALKKAKNTVKNIDYSFEYPY